jgi:hypothetical protein
MPLLRGGRPAWKPGMVAGERRRPAASSMSDMVSSRGPLQCTDDRNYDASRDGEAVVGRSRALRNRTDPAHGKERRTRLASEGR